MKNIKFITICAASGFVLSLVCGFFSHSSFGRIFLIALIFGIIFGGLALGISLIYDRFLVLEAYAEGGGTQAEGFAASDNSKKVLGQHVDLVIQEEELEQTGNHNHYDVGENHQMLNESDYNHNGENESGTTNQIQEKNEFVPIRNFETVNNFSGNESMTSKESDERREIIAEQNEKKGSQLDVLPDMSDLKLASDSSPDSETVVLSDADEEEFVHSATNYKASDASNGEIKDASLMAKAISSILAEES